jgi:hypothetical protein
MGTITYNGTNSNGDDAVFRGTYDVEYADITVDVDTSSMPGAAATTTYTGKCVGGEFFVPQNALEIPETRIKQNNVGSINALHTYNITPILIRCNNGDLLCLYTAGEAHRSTSDLFVYKRLPAGADIQTGWGEETLIASEPTWGARKTGGGCGVDPKTGRVMVTWITMADADGNFEMFNFYYMYSDDHGVTWSTPVDLYSQFISAGTSLYPSRYPLVSPDNKPDVRFFGDIQRTSKGLMCFVYVPRMAMLAVFSYDDGETWDIANPVQIWSTDGSQGLNEPNSVFVDQDNIVLICRDDDPDQQYKAAFSQTTDGGATWSTMSSSIPFAATPTEMPPGNSAQNAVRVGDRVYGCFTVREPVGKFHHTCLNVTDFLATPSDLWDINATNQLRTTYDIYPDGAADDYEDAGYPQFATLAGHEYTALVTYYTPSDPITTNHTDIAIRTMTRI